MDGEPFELNEPEVSLGDLVSRLSNEAGISSELTSSWPRLR